MRIEQQLHLNERARLRRLQELLGQVRPILRLGLGLGREALLHHGDDLFTSIDLGDASRLEGELHFAQQAHVCVLGHALMSGDQLH